MSQAKIQENLLVPTYFSDLEENVGLLFVGMNPSFSVSAIQKAHVQLGHNIENASDYYSWGNRDTFCMVREKELGSWSRQNYSYFRFHRDWSSDLDVKWEHLDLFQVRETSQAVLTAMRQGFPKFFDDQLSVLRMAIKFVNPRAIIIGNASAAKIFIEHFDCEEDADMARHILIVNKSRVPVFSSAMLTGQRALDIYSRARLFRDLREYLKQVAS